MRPALMGPHGGFDPTAAPPDDSSDVRRDLGLDVLVARMAAGDERIAAAARTALLRPLQSPEEIGYRQRVLTDCLHRPAAVRSLYRTAAQAVQAERRILRGFTTESAEPLLHRAGKVLTTLAAHLARLPAVADEERDMVRSEGLTGLFGLIRTELDDAFQHDLSAHLRRVSSPDGLLLSAALAPGGHGTDYLLHRHTDGPGTWARRVRSVTGAGTVTVSSQDDAGLQALAELRAVAIASVAVVLARAADQVTEFFTALRDQLAFYVGCLNLHEALCEAGGTTCLPDPRPAGTGLRTGRGLYDPVLRLLTAGPVVGSDVNAVDRPLVVVTGANRGGKSTFLRGMGLAQLMMQAGMFVPADSFTAPVVTGVFTHFRRGDDGEEEGGTLSGELSRMGRLVDEMSPGALLLSNESFASTDEHTAAAIGAPLVAALLDSGVEVHLVTHLHELAETVNRDEDGRALFLRAERRPDGFRTFRMVPGRPRATSDAVEIFTRAFGSPAD
jgi:hypothetical protein